MGNQKNNDANAQLILALSQGTPARIIRWGLVLFAGLMLLMVVNLPLKAFWNTKLARDLELNGRTVSARVEAEISCPAKRGPVPCYELAYTVNGHSYRPQDRHQDLKVGQTLTLRYAPLDPGYYRLTSDPPAAPWDQGLTSKMLITTSLSLFFGLIIWQILRQAWQGKGFPLS